MDRLYDCTACGWWDDVRPEAGVCPACGAPVKWMPQLDPSERADYERNEDRDD